MEKEFIRALWWCDFSAAMSNLTGRSSATISKDYENIKPMEREYEVVDEGIVNRFVMEDISRINILQFMKDHDLEEFILLAD